MLLKTVLVGSGLAGVSLGQMTGFSNGSSTATSMAAPRPLSTLLVSVRPATNGTVLVTKVLTAYTTYCPEATEVHVGSKTYTVTEATTLTILDCPCTIVETHKLPSPGQAMPTIPLAPGPAKPGPVNPGNNGPVNPGNNGPVNPGNNGPVNPGNNSPVNPGNNGPVSPGNNGPVNPGNNGPVNPGNNGPVSPGNNTAKPSTPAVIAAAGARSVAYGLAMAAAGIVGAIAL